MNDQAGAWLDTELDGYDLADQRLTKRLRKVLTQLGGAMGQSIPHACQDWANTKAAYRFIANDRVSEAEILAGHFRSTGERIGAHDGLILMLHDTTEFSYRRERPEAIGITKSINSGKDKEGRLRTHTVCGIMMHSSLATTTDGLPLGLTAVKFWTRDKFKGTAALKRKINPTRVPIEQKESVRWLENLRQSTALMDQPKRCVHIGDRECDIYELFCAAQTAGTHFLVRTCVDRLAGDGDHTIADEMAEVRVKGLHRIEDRDRDGNPWKATLEIRYRRIHVLPPIGKQKHYPALFLTVIHAEERGTPASRDKIVWKLITDLPARSRRDAVDKIQWYALRWKIEVFHNVLKSGCKAEEVKLRTAQHLTYLLAVFCILSSRVFWMTMVNRSVPDAPPSLVLDKIELALLDHAASGTAPLDQRTLAYYLTKIARLGGYLARAPDPPPGNMVMWRGMTRLTDIRFGAMIGRRLVGIHMVSAFAKQLNRVKIADNSLAPDRAGWQAGWQICGRL